MKQHNSFQIYSIAPLTPTQPHFCSLLSYKIDTVSYRPSKWRYLFFPTLKARRTRVRSEVVFLGPVLRHLRLCSLHHFTASSASHPRNSILSEPKTSTSERADSLADGHFSLARNSGLHPSAAPSYHCRAWPTGGHTCRQCNIVIRHTLSSCDE